ncbi:TonB-dependent receptor domain-containing protein [Niabella insulamsoli]|uniref:outer membrane beta-barrel family protein n=1 Tax=Niabella insulamsoli TaxID=3144874 RepID=UPI0031FD1B55
MFVRIQAILICLVCSVVAHSQVTVTGEVLDAANAQPLNTAVVEIRDNNTQKVLQRLNTDASGKFTAQAATELIVVEISFVGYKPKTIKKPKITGQQIDLGTIVLSKSEVTLEEVVVRAEKSSTEFKLDKRIFNVGQDLSSTGMSALEVLNNVPSVMVNIDGQISLRGNSGVQILINGKPSVLADESSNALGTITADMIERIEVITNPSAKYEAEGTAGILNIILKKEKSKDLNGSISVNTGIPDNHSVGVSMNRRTNKFNLFTQFGLGRRSLPRYNSGINRDLVNNTEILTDGVNYRNEKFYNITLGTDYHINDLNVLTLSGSFAYEVEDQPSETNYQSFENNNLVAAWKRNEVTEATNPKWQYELNYERQFKDNEKHTLLASAIGSFFGKDQSSVFTNRAVTGTIDENDQQANTDFKEANYTFKLDYTKPLGEKFTIETGTQYLMNEVGNDYEISDLLEGAWVPNPDLTNNFTFDQKVLGVYGTGSYEADKWGIKAGLRVENTDLVTLLETTNQGNNRNYTNLFPSLHTSYKISPEVSLQLGYSRRIYRPRLWQLNPFLSLRDNYNISTGNPELDPEYSDSYELTGIFKVGKATLNSSVYHRYTTAVIEDVSTFENNVNTNKPYNIGTRAATGIEINGKYDPLRWLTFNGDFNFNIFQRKGVFIDRNFDFNGQQWSGRLTSKLDLPADFDLELSGNYRSGFESVNAVNEPFAYMDLGVRKKLFKGRIIASAAVNDVFASRIQISATNRERFYLYNRGYRGRFITFGLSYGFGKGEAMTYSGGRRR